MTTTQTTETGATQTITLRGREFTVSKQDMNAKGPAYILTGKRGAVYGTMRNANHPAVMFLVGLGKSFGIPAGFDRTYLTDIDGKLESIRGWYTNRETGALIVQR